MRTMSVLVVGVSAMVAACGMPDKGSVAALESDGTTVIAAKKCRRRGQTYDYVTCGKAFRAEMVDKLCTERGVGRHGYLYRTGTSEPIAQTVICK